MKKILSVFFILIFPILHNASAQKNDSQIWTQVTGIFNLERSKTYQFSLEAQPRIGDNSSQIERLLVRPSLIYNHSDKLAFSIGYAWTPTYMNSKYESDFRNENRTWEQVLFRQSADRFKFQHRLRLEQRFIDDAKDSSNRLRYLFRTSHGICDEDKIGITGYNEVFLNFNSAKGGPDSGFDRNRFFIGPYLQADQVRYEVGYLGEYARRFGSDDRYISALLVSAAINF